MRRALLALPLLVLAGGGLSGCIAAIPAIAGSALVGREVGGEADAAPAPAPAPAPAQDAPVPAALQEPPPPPAPVPPLPSAPQPAPGSGTMAGDAPAPASTGMAQMVRYARKLAAVARGSDGQAAASVPSALLADPVALDGQRRMCEAGAQAVAVIDLDPAGGTLAIPSAPRQAPGLALGLAVLREAGVVIAWISDLPIEQAGALRTALEQAGLDPRGQDIIALDVGAQDRKQVRRENLGTAACIVAIGGDERPDFDERFRYLRSPQAGAALEPLIGDGWFLIEPVFAQ